MTYFEMFNQVKEETDVQVVVDLIKQEALQELAGDDFTIRPKRQSSSDDRAKVYAEANKEIKKREKETGKPLNKEEKAKVRQEIKASMA